MTRIILVGAPGRMGQAIVRSSLALAGFTITAALGRGDDLASPLAEGDAVIDFSRREVTLPLARLAATAGKPLVIGTTGHNASELQEIHDLAGRIPIVLAPNFSVGVNLLFYLTRKAAEVLGADYDQEVVEMHHRLKIDAPSGTAKRLGEVLCEVKGRPYSELIRDGRQGETGQRSREEIGMHALRGGDVVGDHTVVFAGIGERVELTHKASNRETFAQGALRAAAWATSQNPGLYSMQDVLGLH